MPQQRSVLWLNAILEVPGSVMLKWCKKLLQPDYFISSSTLLMLARGPNTGSPKHDKNYSQHEPPHPHCIWGLLTQLANHSTWATPITGIGQGNGAGPPIWAAVSLPMFQIMCQDGFYALLIGAIFQQSQKVAGFAFVDDTDLCVMHPTNQVAPVIANMQKVVTHWEGLLRVMGRVLVLEKCFWYLIDFECSSNKWKYKQCHQIPGSISILDTDCWQVTIQRLEPSKAWWTLGIRLAPDGNVSTELTYLLDTAKDWQCKMKNLKLSRMESIFSLWQVLLRKLGYPLPATTFTQEQCQTIMSPILAQGLPLAGFVWTFPHALVHGPLKFCGISIPNLFMEQTLMHIHTLLKFSNQPQDLTSFLLWAMGEIMQLELGLWGQLFEAPTVLQDCITDLWMKHTWLATCQSGYPLTGRHPRLPTQQAWR